MAETCGETYEPVGWDRWACALDPGHDGNHYGPCIRWDREWPRPPDRSWRNDSDSGWESWQFDLLICGGTVERVKEAIRGVRAHVMQARNLDAPVTSAAEGVLREIAFILAAKGTPPEEQVARIAATIREHQQNVSGPRYSGPVDEESGSAPG